MVHHPPLTPLGRPPRTELSASVRELDETAFAAADAAVAALHAAMDKSTSLDQLHLLGTQAQMLLAMKGTHRAVRRLLEADSRQMDLSLEALPVARVQLERCFLALLIQDNPRRWHARYRQNAWKAFAEKFFRDQQLLARFPPYAEYFGPSGDGVRLLREFAHGMDVSEDAFQTLRAQIAGEDPDPRFKTWFIPDMPTPGRCLDELTDPTHRHLAGLLYPFYDNLSHFSHGGLVGVMEAAILRRDPAAAGTDEQRRRFWRANVLEQALPLSYVALLLAATLFARGHLAAGCLREALLGAWRPYHSDGSPLGVAIWDAWAAGILGAGGQPAKE